MIDKRHIDEVARVLHGSEPVLKGKWAIELDEEGFEIAVMRDGSGSPLAFMNADDARTAGFIRGLFERLLAYLQEDGVVSARIVTGRENRIEFETNCGSSGSMSLSWCLRQLR